MEIFIPENVNKIITVLEKNGFEAYLVGGYVRDSMLGKVPKDYDIASSASPEEVRKCFPDRRVIDTGEKHGTVTVAAGDDFVEVTTFRVDGNYENHRRPESVTFSRSLADDLSRRDFTINAMAYNPRVGIIDMFGGQKDLFRRRIKCVGEPAVRFNEDALRIMRALRFASELGFEIDPVTATAVHDMKYLLKDISREKVSKELDLIVTGMSPADVLIRFADVFCTLIPEIKPCIGFDQHSRYHVYDVWTHSAYAVEHCKPERDVRLALLFHDIAKPECFVMDDEGNGHFPGHENRGAEITSEVMRRLRYSNETVDSVSELVKYHYITPLDDKTVVKRILSIMGASGFFRLTELMKGDSRAKQSSCFERVQILESMEEIAHSVIAAKECTSISQLSVNGKDIAALGALGKEIGDILENLLSLVIEGKIDNTKNELLKQAGKMLDVMELQARG